MAGYHMTQHGDPSVFTVAMMAANSLKNPALLTTPLRKTLAERGFHSPVYISTPTIIDDKSTAERLGATVAGLLTLACEETGNNDMHVASFAWRNPALYSIGMAVGRHAENQPPVTAFPSQRVVQALQKLREELLGTGTGNISPLWQLTTVDEEGKGLVPVYKFEASSEREKILQELVKNIIILQKGHHPLETKEGGKTLLFVPQQDLENAVGKEVSSLSRL